MALTVVQPGVGGTGATNLTYPNTGGTVMVSGNMPAFNASFGSNQNISNSTATIGPFASKLFDTAGCFNNTGSTVTLNGISTPAYSFAPNVAGYYFFTFNSSSSAINGETWAFINKNSTGYLVYDIQATNTYGQTGSILLYANGTTDYFNVTIVQTSGSTKQFSSDSKFMGYLVRTA